VLAFGARAYTYGGALGHFQFLQEEAQGAQQSWQDWARRAMTVQANCVLLPDQMSAGVLMQGHGDLTPREGVARRIAGLPTQEEERAPAGLRLVFPTLASALQTLPAEQELRVTLLSDAPADQYETLRNAWQQQWRAATRRAPPATVTLTAEWSYQWIDEKLKSASSAIELIVVLQVHGGVAYSDGLAALLLCPDSLARARELPETAALLRPMPLEIDTLESELPLFLQTQASARQATGLLADGADWQPLAGQIMAIGGAHGAALLAEQRWFQESLCGLPGPFSSWLLAAFAVEMTRHQRKPLLVLTQEHSRRWISTVTPGE